MFARSGRGCRRTLAVLVSVALSASSLSSLALPARAMAVAPQTTAPAESSRAPVAAPAPTVVRELTERRTANATHYLLSDGTARAEIQERPVRYKDVSGAWKPIDTALVPDAAPGRVRAASVPLAISIGSQDDSRGPVTLTGDGYSVSIDYLGGFEDTKLVVGNRAIYQDVANNTDLSYEVRDDGIKETVLLASADCTASRILDRIGPE